jgi:hypothetical protein
MRGHGGGKGTSAARDDRVGCTGAWQRAAELEEKTWLRCEGIRGEQGNSGGVAT